MKNYLVIGMNPSNVVPNSKCTTRVKFYRWMTDIGFPNYDFVNVSDKKGDFTYTEKDLIKIKNIASKYDTVVGLGGAVSGILKKLDIDHFKFPHPSGRNRQWNDPTFLSKCLDECQEYLINRI